MSGVAIGERGLHALVREEGFFEFSEGEVLDLSDSLSGQSEGRSCLI